MILYNFTTYDSVARAGFFMLFEIIIININVIIIIIISEIKIFQEMDFWRQSARI